MELSYGPWTAGGEEQAQKNQVSIAIEKALAQFEVHNLVDVLFATKVARIGDPIVVEESNRHIIFKIICRDRKTPDRDELIQEFLAAAMRKTGRYPKVRVSILYVGQASDNFMILKAFW